MCHNMHCLIWNVKNMCSRLAVFCLMDDNGIGPRGKASRTVPGKK